jgi:hypothetical protein
MNTTCQCSKLAVAAINHGDRGGCSSFKDQYPDYGEEDGLRERTKTFGKQA